MVFKRILLRCGPPLNFLNLALKREFSFCNLFSKVGVLFSVIASGTLALAKVTKSEDLCPNVSSMVLCFCHRKNNLFGISMEYKGVFPEVTLT